MSLPVGVTTRTLSIGRPFNALGVTGVLKISVTPIFGGTAQRLVWSATGDTFEAFTVTPPAQTDPDGDNTESIDLPIVDQAGWLDGSGNAITGWSYQVTVTPSFPANGQPNRQKPYTKFVSPKLAMSSPIDMDRLPDGTAASPVLAPGPYTTAGDIYVNVKSQYGAEGDGATDDTTALQAAIDALATAGGGVAFLPRGTYIASTLNLRTRVKLLGEGPGVTVIKKKAASTGNLVQTLNFATLATFNVNAAATGAGYQYQFAVDSVTLDGNKANCPSGGIGLAICGCEYRLMNLHLVRNKSHGLFTEWRGASPLSNTADFTESFGNNIKTMDNDGHGWWEMGPHDSSFDLLSSGRNALSGFRIEGSGCHYLHPHSWGYQQYAFDLRGHCILTQPQGEGGTIGQFNISWHKVHIIGGSAFYAGAPSAFGVRIGDLTATEAAKDILVKGMLIRQGDATIALSPAVDFSNVGRGLHLDVVASCDAAGTTSTGTVPDDAYVSIQAVGGYA